jgi:hypothetical protein
MTQPQPYAQQPGQPYPNQNQQPPVQPPKKRKKWPWILLAVVVVAIIAAVAGGGSDDEATVLSTSGVPSVEAQAPEAPPNPIGATLQIEDGSVTTAVTVADLIPSSGSQYGLPTQGELHQVTVTLQGVEGTTNVNPLYFSARAADGTTYDAALGSVDGQLNAGELTAGDIVKGVVGFDVTGAPIQSIRYEGPLGDSLGSWVVQ